VEQRTLLYIVVGEPLQADVFLRRTSLPHLVGPEVLRWCGLAAISTKAALVGAACGRSFFYLARWSMAQTLNHASLGNTLRFVGGNSVSLFECLEGAAVDLGGVGVVPVARGQVAFEFGFATVGVVAMAQVGALLHLAGDDLHLRG